MPQIKNDLGVGRTTLKLTSSKVCAYLMNMATAMLLSRFRTLDEYGTYSQLLLCVNLVTSIFMLGLPNSINFFLSKANNRYERKSFLSSYYTLSTLLSIISGLLLVFMLPYIKMYFKNPSIADFWFILAFYPWTKIILASIENILVVSYKTTIMVWFRIINSILLLVSVLVAYFYKWKFQSYMILFIICESICALAVYFIVQFFVSSFKFTISKELTKTIFSFSVPIGIASVIGTLNIEFDKLLISTYYDANFMAIYTNASRELPVTLLTTSVTAAILPHLVKKLQNGKVSETLTLWRKSMQLLYIIICFIATALFVYAPEVLGFLYSEKYLAGVGIFRIYCFLLLLRFTYFGMILNATGKTKYITFSSVCSLVINVILNYYFYMIWGFTGPAMATVVSQLVSASIQLICSSRLLQIKISRIIPIKELVDISIINILFGIFFYFIKIYFPIDQYINIYVKAIVEGLIWLYIYFRVMKNKIIRLYTTLY